MIIKHFREGEVLNQKQEVPRKKKKFPTLYHCFWKDQDHKSKSATRELSYSEGGYGTNYTVKQRPLRPHS